VEDPLEEAFQAAEDPLEEDSQEVEDHQSLSPQQQLSQVDEGINLWETPHVYSREIETPQKNSSPNGNFTKQSILPTTL
jgi:hypothetical protein